LKQLWVSRSGEGACAGNQVLAGDCFEAQRAAAERHTRPQACHAVIVAAFAAGDLGRGIGIVNGDLVHVKLLAPWIAVAVAKPALVFMSRPVTAGGRHDSMQVQNMQELKTVI